MQKAALGRPRIFTQFRTVGMASRAVASLKPLNCLQSCPADEHLGEGGVWRPEQDWDFDGTLMGC